MFHISSPIGLFSYVKVKDAFCFVWIQDQTSSGEGKRKSKWGYEGDPKSGFFLQNSHYKVRYKLYLTNCWSDKLLTTTIVISTSKKLNVQTFKWFWAVLPGQKQLCFCIVKEKYGFQIGNAMDKNKLHFDQGEMLKIAWYSTHVGFWICWFQWHRFWSCTFRHFWVMGYMYALSWKLLIIGLLLEYLQHYLKDYIWRN